MAPQVGLEPTTLRLTAECSAIELLRSVVKRARSARLFDYHSIRLRSVKMYGALWLLRDFHFWQCLAFAAGSC
jgi:hypothetical protein